MENNLQEQQHTVPELDIALAIPLPESPRNELNLALPDSSDENTLAEIKNSNSDLSQLYDSVSNDSDERITSEENDFSISSSGNCCKSFGDEADQDVKAKKDEISKQDEIPKIDENPKQDDIPDHDKIIVNDDLPEDGHQLELEHTGNDSHMEKGYDKTLVTDDIPKDGEQLEQNGDKSQVEESDKIANGELEKGDELKDDEPKSDNCEENVQPEEKGDHNVPIWEQPSTSRGEPILSYNAEPFTPVGKRLLNEIVKALPDFSCPRNTQDNDENESFSLPSPKSSIRVKSNIKIDILGKPRFNPIRQNNNRPQRFNNTQAYIVPYQNPQANYDPQNNYMANYVHDPNSYIQDPQKIYQIPPFVIDQPNQAEQVDYQNSTLMSYDSNAQYAGTNNVLQYTETSNVDTPPGYQQDEISDTFYQLPESLLQPSDPNIVYQYQYMPEGFDAYYPCLQNVDPVYIPQADYRQPQPTAGPSSHEMPNIYPGGYYQQSLGAPNFYGLVPQVNMIPTYSQNQLPVPSQQMRPNISSRNRSNAEPHPRSQSGSPPRKIIARAKPDFVPPKSPRQSRPRQRPFTPPRPQYPLRPNVVTQIRLPTISYRPFWYPRRRSPDPLMKPSWDNHNPAMLPIYKTMQSNGLGKVIPPISSHELTNEIVSSVPSPHGSPVVSPRKLPAMSADVSPPSAPRVISPRVSPRIAPPVRVPRIEHRQILPKVERENRYNVPRKVSRVIRKPKMCRIEQQKSNASYTQNLRFRHLLDDDEVYLLENLDLREVRNVDTGVQALDLEEYLLIANIGVVHHVEHRSDTDLTTFTSRNEISRLLSNTQRRATYDLHTLQRKSSWRKKSRVKSVAVTTDTLETRTTKTQTDVLDIKIPFKTITPTKFKLRENKFKSCLKGKSSSTSSKKSVTFSLESSHSLSERKDKQYAKYFECLEISRIGEEPNFDHLFELLHDDTTAQPSPHKVFNKPAEELKSPRLVPIENIPSTSQNSHIVETSRSQQVSQLEIDMQEKLYPLRVDCETPCQQIPVVKQFAPKKVDKFVPLKPNIPFKNFSDCEIPNKQKILRNKEPISSTSNYQDPVYYKGPKEVLRAPKPRKTRSILKRVPSKKRIPCCRALNMDDTPNTTPLQKIAVVDPTTPKSKKNIRINLDTLPKMETLPKASIPIYMDPVEDVDSSSEYTTPVLQKIPEVEANAPKPKRTRLDGPFLSEKLIYDTPGSSRDETYVYNDDLSTSEEYTTPVLQKIPEVEATAPIKVKPSVDYTTATLRQILEAIMSLDKPSISGALTHDTPGSSTEPTVSIPKSKDAISLEDNHPECIAPNVEDSMISTSAEQLPEANFDLQPSTSQENPTTRSKYVSFSWADECESLDIQPGTGLWQDPEEQSPQEDDGVPLAPRRKRAQPGETTHVSYAQVVAQNNAHPSRNTQLPEPDYRRLTILELTLSQRLQPNGLQKQFGAYMNRGMHVKSIGRDVILLIFREPNDANEVLHKSCALGSVVTLEHASQRSRDAATRYRIGLRRKQTRTGRRFVARY